MKFSLSSHQTAEYLKKADEIRVLYKDHNIIPDLLEKYPTATINLVKFDSEPVDWQKIQLYWGLSQGRFMLGLINAQDIGEALNRKIPVYHRVPAHSFFELRDMEQAGMCAAYIGAPIFFQTDKMNNFTIPIHHIANLATPEGSLSKQDGVCGTWIRPEDVRVYEPYIDTLEFSGNIQQEQALVRIYAEQHKWGGSLHDVIFDLEHNALSRMLPPHLIEMRMQCGQKCMAMPQKCQLCRRYFDLASREKMLKIQDLSTSI